MKQKFFNFIQNPIVSIFAVGVIVSEIANATSGAGVSPAPALVSTFSGLGGGLLCPIINVMFWVLLVVSIIMILWAAFLYATSEGDSEKPSQARKMILYAAVGIVIALLAKGVPNIIFNLFGQGSAASNPLVCGIS